MPSISSLELYYTDSIHNLRAATNVPVKDGSFTVDVPADSVFTLVATNPPPAPPPPPTPTFSFGPPLNPVWDVSGTYQLTNYLQGAKLEPMAIVFSDVMLDVDAHGHLQGTGTIPVLLGGDTVAGDYKLTGSVTGGGAKTYVKFNIKCKGQGVVAGVLTTFNITAKYDLQVNPVGLTMVGKTTGNAHFSNRGSGTLKWAVSLPLPPGVDGGWNVTLNTYPTGTKLAGTAVVQVDNTPPTMLATKASGTLSKQSTVAKLKLSGYGFSAGTQVNLEYTPILGAGDILRTVKGKVLGQNLKK